MRFLASILRLLIRATALVLALAAAALFAAERSGTLARAVRDRLAGALGELGQGLAIERARLRWFEPSLELEGVSLRTGGELLTLERVRIVLAFDGLASPSLKRIEAARGRLRWTAELVEAAKGVRSWEKGAPDPQRKQRWPAISLTGLDVEMVHPELGLLPFGRLGFSFEPDRDSGPALLGHLEPALASDPGAGLELRGHLSDAAELVVEGWARDLRLEVGSLPADGLLGGLHSLDPKLDLSLLAMARIDLESGAPSSMILRAALTNGSLQPPGTAYPVEEIRLDVEAHYGPPTGREGSARVEGAVRGRATWNGCPLEAGGLLGRSAGPDEFLRAWMRAARLPLDEETRLALAADEELGRALDAVLPEGTLDLLLGLRLQRDRSLRRPELLADVLIEGDARATYQGWLKRRTGLRSGFPVPVEGIRGRVVATVDPLRERGTVVGLVGLAGRLATAPGERGAEVSIDGVLLSGRRGQPGEQGLEQIEVRFEGATGGPGLGRGFEGLRGAEWVWDAFSPEGGSMSGRCRIARTEHSPRSTVHVVAHMDGVDARWRKLPVPILGASGQVEYVEDARGETGVRFRAEGRLSTAESVSVLGRVQSPGTGDNRPGVENQLICVEAAFGDMSLRGDDVEILARTLEGVRGTLDEIAPTGKVDARVRMVQRSPQHPSDYEVELWPRQVRLQPRDFPVPASNVRGRFLVAHRDPGEGASGVSASTDLRALPLVGQWTGGSQVAVMGFFPDAEESTLEITAAGVRTDDRNLLAAVANSVGRDRSAPADLGGLSLDGRVDFTGKIRIPSGSGAEEAASESTFRARLRRNNLFVDRERPTLREIEGSVDLGSEGLFGRRLDAVVGSSPVELEDTRFAVGEAGGWSLTTALLAKDYPLDREHLEVFLDPQALDSLLEELHWRGRVDVQESRLEVTGLPGGRRSVAFRGDLLLGDMSMELGLPLHVRSAALRLHSMVWEKGQVRAWAEMDGLFGEIADRRLEDARLMMTYVHPHLNLLDLEGTLEGGAVRGLRGQRARTGPVFSIDLEPPYRFELAGTLEGVDVKGLLEGVFESNVEDRGRLSSDLRLAGSLEAVSDLRGSGTIEIQNARLWSIPVMREIFSRLGFDGTAVFDSVFTRFELEEGVIRMDDVIVTSPLLHLVGGGSLDLDGSLSFELQVRYDLVDRLPALNRLLYWVQNNLLALSVRGDMSRPLVLMRGILSFLRNPPADRSRDLPLPRLTPLPERF